jgi:hypothetical protein
MSYDIERYIDDFTTRLKLVLNTKITALNNEKGDSLLNTISNDAYFYKKTSTLAKSYQEFVYYEPVEDVALNSVDFGGVYVIPYIMEFGIAFRDNARNTDKDEVNHKKVLRYQKAFKEAIKEASSKLRAYGNMQINSVKSSNETRDDSLLHLSSFNLIFTMQG